MCSHIVESENLPLRDYAVIEFTRELEPFCNAVEIVVTASTQSNSEMYLQLNPS